MLNQTICTVSLLAIAGAASGSPFTTLGAAVRNLESLTPSSGSFVTQLPAPDAENTYLTSENVTVVNDRAVWRDEGDTIMASTWLATDPLGPKGADGTATYGTGWAKALTGPVGGPVHVPTWNYSLGPSDGGLAVNGTNGDPVNGDGLSPGFYGRISGFLWSGNPNDNFVCTSALSLVNGRMAQSLFLGHFVLSDPNATILGANLLVYYYADLPPGSSPGSLVPLDGSRGRILVGTNPYTLGPEVPIWIEFERTTFTNSAGTFTALDMYLLPSPSTGGALMAAALGLLSGRRRR